MTLYGAGAGVPAIVNIVEELGAEAYIYARLEHTAADRNGGGSRDFVVRVDPKTGPPIGSRIELHVRPESVLLFDADSGARIVAE